MKLLDIINENTITPPEIPNTQNFWHGGNLNDYNDIISQKNGRYEYGPGLYITTHYSTARKYAKGSRKLYLITVANGTDINNALIDINDAKDFVNMYVISKLKKDVWNRIENNTKDNKIKGFIFNNILLNSNAIKPTNTKHLRQFYVNNNIDYEIVHNPFGWGEKMMVLYNMNKIVNVVIIKPNDNIINYNL